MTNKISFKNFCVFLNSSINWNLFFKVTNLCNFNCAHCCECSGPTEVANFIPIPDVRLIIDNFKREKNKVMIAAISGGEPMTAYQHKDYYIPQLMKTLASNGLNIELKTNAAWTMQSKADKIFNDLEMFSIKYPNIYTAYHLSLDSFHPNAMQSVTEFIRRYYNNDKLSPKTCVHILYDKPDILIETLMGLGTKHNIMLDMKNGPTNEFSKLGAKQFVGKNKYVVIEQYSEISNLGRARQNNIATNTLKTIQNEFLGKITQNHSLTFDNRGMAFIDCVSEMASTPYRDACGRIKPMSVIKAELFEQLYKQYLLEKDR